MNDEAQVSFRYIADDHALEEACAELSRERVLAFDLESDNNLHHYGARICLLQFATPAHNFLIDALAGMDLTPVQAIMESETVEIIMHDTDFDMRSLDGEFGWRPRRLFDTLIAARLCGHKRFGIAALIEHYFGVAVQKKFQRADWSRRPLLPGMLQYAAGDVHYLLKLRERFIVELEALGRMAWAREEFIRCERIRFEVDDRPAFVRVKGAMTLGGRQLAVLDELALARDLLARKLDLPPFKLMADAVLVNLALHPPINAAGFARMKGMHPHCRGGGAGVLADAITRGLERQPLAWPRKAQNGKRLHKSPELFDALRSWRTQISEREGLEPDLVMPMAALKRLAAGEGVAAVLGEEPVKRWQAKRYRGELETFFKTVRRR